MLIGRDIMMPIILTDSAKRRIEEIGKATMTFRVWGVNPPGHLAVEVFFEDKRFPGIKYEKFQHENLTTYIPTNHYDYINGVTVDFSGWSEEDESRYNSDDETLEDQDAAKEILVGWSGVVDDDGKEIKFGESTLNQLLEIPTVAGQIVRSWFESIEVAKKKN